MNKYRLGILLVLSLLSVSLSLRAENEPVRSPTGPMLNLDFQSATNGLIPNKAFYPLYVPQGQLPIKRLLGEYMLVLTPNFGLEIPHSSLIQPDGSGWVVSVTVGARPDGGYGMVLSQTDGEHGYAIYLKDGVPHVVVRTGNCSMMLKEDHSTGITDCRKKMTTIDLRIEKDKAILDINHSRITVVTLDAPLKGGIMPIRIGKHNKLPDFLKSVPGGVKPTGISGAISALKIWRQ